MCRPSIKCGVLLHEMFMEQIRRFAREVLPALQTHQVERVPRWRRSQPRTDLTRLALPLRGAVARRSNLDRASAQQAEIAPPRAEPAARNDM
jgi:hypothetical protein